MKTIIAFMLSLSALAVMAADVAPYQAYLLKNEDYAKLTGDVQVLKAELDKLGESLCPGYINISQNGNGNPEENAAAVKLRQTVNQSPEFRKLATAYALKSIELLILEAKICAGATDPATVALLKEQFVKEHPSIFNADAVPKKEIPGSPAFRHAMYVADKVKEEGAAKQKWPLMHATVWLTQNLKPAAYDDPACRQAYYQTQITQLAAMKKRMEIMAANPELMDNIRLARQAIDPAKPETQKDFQQYFAEMQNIIAADPEYQKLNEANRLAALAEMQTLEAFAAQSDLPQAVEYRAFKAAITAPTK